MKSLCRLAESPLAVLLLTSLLGAQTEPPQAKPNSAVPDAAMMSPVMALANYMAHVQGAVPPAVFADDGLIIVEDFAPYLFSGRQAAAQWNAGFRRHATPLRDLKFTFGPAHDFERTGDRVFFVLPTTWRGIYKDRRFEEHGAWSFVLKDKAGKWRILAYGWGATDLTDRPADSP